MGLDHWQPRLRAKVRTSGKAFTGGSRFYGYHWFAGAPVKAPAKPGFPSTDKPNQAPNSSPPTTPWHLAKAYGGRVEWDPVDRSAWIFFYRDDLREWIFFTDARTFRERYTLVKEPRPAGICSWVLGDEDAGIWELCLPTNECSRGALVPVPSICKSSNLPSSLFVCLGTRHASAAAIPVLSSILPSIVFGIVPLKGAAWKSLPKSRRQGKTRSTCFLASALSARPFMAGVELVRKGKSQPVGSLTQMGTIRLGKRTDARFAAHQEIRSPRRANGPNLWRVGHFQG